MPTAERLTGLARSTAFVPTSISGLVGWFDATQLKPAAVDPASLAGGTPDAWFKADAIASLADGDPVSTWSDSTANGHSLTASLTLRPLYKTNILNSLPVVRFDGINDTLTMDSTLNSLFSGVAACTVFVVASSANTATINDVLAFSWTGGTGGGIVIYGFDNVGARFYHIGRRLAADALQETVGPTAIAANTFRVYACSDNPAGALGIKTYFNDTLEQSNSHASTGVFGTGTGGTGTVGSSGGTNPMAGDIAEIIVWKRLLTTLERMQIDHYLATKYAIASTPTADAEPIGDWPDLSGQLNHLSQTASQRPLLKLAIQNSLPVARFDGTNDVITSGTVTTINDPLSVFIVGKRTSTAAAGTYFDGTGTVGFVRGTTATPKYKIWNGTATGTSDTSWHQISAIANGASDALYVDGATVIAASAQGAPSITVFNIGADAAGAGNWFNGDIAEVLVYNTALSDPNRQLVEAYLKAKWATP